ncbi:MAG TPA: hypothetical protein PKW90_11135 [Myxococcota bacterium]|nr:hypothetical protein [Myxococcota bacterium]
MLLLTLWACSGSTETPKTDGASLVVPAELLATSWQVRMADATARAPFEGRDAWVQYFQGQRKAALTGFAQEGDKPALARLHGEYAALYRQAALTSSAAIVQTFGADSQPTDPKEMAYLVGVSGRLMKEDSWSAKLGSSSGTSVAPQDAAFKAWDGSWPPATALALVPGFPGPATAGMLPDVGTLPSYSFPHQGEEGTLGMTDPATLVALSIYHEEAAKLADPSSAEAVAMLLDPWRLPVETASTARPQLADPYLFMSFLSTSGDAAFLADLVSTGANAVAAHQKDSPYAVIVARCTAEGTVNPDCVIEQSGALAKAIEGKMQEVAGKEDSFYRAFADFARVGALRAADRAAFVMGDREGGGRLRINALDRSTGTARDPLFVLSVAAWDAGNRNSLRCADLLHTLMSEIPGLEAVRFPVDALQIRVGRNAAPAGPSH